MVTQILRMVFGYNPQPGADLTSLAPLSLWTGLHLGCAIICTCLPVFRVFLPKDNGMASNKLRFIYRSASGWLSRSRTSRTLSGSNSTSNNSRRKRASLPSFVGTYSHQSPRSLEPDQIHLTNFSIMSEVEVLGASEYHLRDVDHHVATK